MDDELLERQIRQRAVAGSGHFAIAYALLRVARQLERLWQRTQAGGETAEAGKAQAGGTRRPETSDNRMNTLSRNHIGAADHESQLK